MLGRASVMAARLEDEAQNRIRIHIMSVKYAEMTYPRGFGGKRTSGKRNGKVWPMW